MSPYEIMAVEEALEYNEEAEQLGSLDSLLFFPTPFCSTSTRAILGKYPFYWDGERTRYRQDVSLPLMALKGR